MNIVHYLFEGKKNSNQAYILYGGLIFTYSEIYFEILKTAFLLKDFKQRAFCIISKNSPFFISSYFGIMASGNISVPLNIKMSKEEFADIVDIVKPAGIFVEKELKGDFNIPPAIKVCDQDEVKNVVFENIALKEYDNEVASIMFTSGSSGKPKGAMISHKNLKANTKSIINYLELKESDRMEVVLPFYYCYGLSLLHTHTRVGGSVVLNNSFVMPNTVIDDIKKYGCTGFAGVPSHFEILIKTTNFLRENFLTLRYITQAGGKMRDETILKIFNSMKAKLIVMYGQTEATARLSYLPYELLPEKIGSIGRGIPGVKLRIIDSDGHDVRVGKVGELIARGDNIMLGYLNGDTSSKIKKEYLYTGDLARKDAEGFIYLEGRKDDLIKIGGYRLSLSEVNAELGRVEGVFDCYTTNRENKLFGNELISLVVLESGFSEKKVISEITKKLANYKIPSKFTFVKEIPLTPAGKVSKDEINKLIENKNHGH